MTISQTTRVVVRHADRELDLSGSLPSRIAVPSNVLSALVIVRRTDSVAWAGSIPVEGNTGPLSPAASIADPGAGVVTASTPLSEEQLAGVESLVIGPVSGGAGIVRNEVRFTVVDA